MRTYITALILAATLALVSCGGGNDVASSGASAVSAAAPSTPTTEAKVNGQVDERTGVAPVVAQATIWTPQSNGGCGNSWSYDGNGPPLNPTQQTACTNASNTANQTQCSALGGQWWPASGGCSGGSAWFTVTSQQQCTEYGGGWSNLTPAFCLI